GRFSNLQLNLGLFSRAQHGEWAEREAGLSWVAFDERWEPRGDKRPPGWRKPCPLAILRELQSLGRIPPDVWPPWVYKRKDGLFGARRRTADGVLDFGPLPTPEQAFAAMAAALGLNFPVVVKPVMLPKPPRPCSGKCGAKGATDAEGRNFAAALTEALAARGV